MKILNLLRGSTTCFLFPGKILRSNLFRWDEGGPIDDFSRGEGVGRYTLSAVQGWQTEPLHDPLQFGELKCVPSLRLDPNAVQFINDSTLRVALLNATVDHTAQALQSISKSLGI